MSGAITHVSLSNIYLRAKGQLEGNMYSDIDTCNLLFSVGGICRKGCDWPLFETTGFTGIGVNRELIDFVAFESLLKSFGKNPKTFDVNLLPPSVQAAYKTITADHDRITCNTELDMIERAPIKRLINLFTHYGIVCHNLTNAKLLTDRERHVFSAITSGKPEKLYNFTLNLPLAHTARFDDMLNSTCRRRRVYMVIGPDDEILCGSTNEMFVSREPEEESVGTRVDQVAEISVTNLTEKDGDPLHEDPEIKALLDRIHNSVNIDRATTITPSDALFNMISLLAFANIYEMKAAGDKLLGEIIQYANKMDELPLMVSLLAPHVVWERVDYTRLSRISKNQLHNFVQLYTNYDQRYTVLFVLMHEHETQQKLIKMMREKCINYSKEK